MLIHDTNLTYNFVKNLSGRARLSLIEYKDSITFLFQQDILLSNSSSAVIRIPENSHGVVLGQLSAVDEDSHKNHRFFLHDFAKHLKIGSENTLKVTVSASRDHNNTFISYALKTKSYVFDSYFIGT